MLFLSCCHRCQAFNLRQKESNTIFYFLHSYQLYWVTICHFQHAHNNIIVCFCTTCTWPDTAHVYVWTFNYDICVVSMLLYSVFHTSTRSVPAHFHILHTVHVSLPFWTFESHWKGQNWNLWTSFLFQDLANFSTFFPSWLDVHPQLCFTHFRFF